MKVSAIDEVQPVPEFIRKSFEIAKLLDTERFTELSAFDTSHVTLIAGLTEISRAGSRQLYYPERLREFVTQLSQGKPDVSSYINTQIDPEEVLVASSGDVAISPTLLENMRLRQEPNYDAVVVKRDIKVTFFDYAIEDGDKIDVYLNGQLLRKAVDLIPYSLFARSLLSLLKEPLTITLDKQLMKAGENVLEIVSVDQAKITTTVGVDFDSANTIYGNWRHTAAIPVGGSFKIKFGLPKIRVNGNAYPYSADHIIDVLGEPRILTIDRAGNVGDKRRNANLKRYNEVGGVTIEERKYDRDESPPAVFAESVNAHVRLIPISDNQESGNQFGIALRSYGSEKIVLQDGWNVDFFATQPTVPTPLFVADVPIDWEYKVI